MNRRQTALMTTGLAFILFSCLYINVYGQKQDFDYNDIINSRDPFVPVVDDKGNLRKVFIRPAKEIVLPALTLMGITKIDDTLYALIDGELIKEGGAYNEMKIKKIYPDKIIIEYAERIFEIPWE